MVYEDEAAKFDIILVHGMNGDATETWETSTGYAWVPEALTRDLSIKFNVWSFSWVDMKGDTSQRLLSAIFRERDERVERPIIFMGHDIGGTFIKSVSGLIDIVKPNTESSSSSSISTNNPRLGLDTSSNASTPWCSSEHHMTP